MSNGRTTEDCKRIIFNLGIKFGVSPKLIATRMLTPQAKCDMLNGDLTIEQLEMWVESSKLNGMFVVNTPLKEGIKTGSRSPQTLETEPERVKCHYRKPFVCHESRLDCHCRSQETA